MTVKLIINSKYNKAIIFHESILEVERINYLLQKRGINSTSYHSKLTGNARYANLSQFKVGIYRVLVTCEALDEGLNVPSLDFAIIAAGNLSKRQRIQRLGRTLRTTKGKTLQLSVYLSNKAAAGTVHDISSKLWYLLHT